MAKSSTFQTKTNSAVTIGTEVTMGTATLAAGVTLQMPVTDYSFSEVASHSLGVAPFRMGGGSAQSDDMVRAQRHDRMYEISMTFLASDKAINRICLALFGDDDGANSLIGSMPAATTHSHGVASIVPVTLHFEDSDPDSTAASGLDTIFKSCMCTSFSLAGDISSEGGMVMGTATFVTGYAPALSALTFSGGTHVFNTSHVNFFNMHDLSKTEINNGGAQDLVLYSFELNISREVNRIGFDTASNSFDPLGYAVGGYEVTGSLTVKRDVESKDAITFADTAEPVVAIDLDTTVFQIQAPKAILDTASINFDDDGWKTVIPFRCTYDGAATSNTVVSINTAA
ncbi:hypothetical protein [uncultured Mediterranean phage uvMED]|nr:hypothetical protein [uncultured Mediterranean phage uvMED]